MRASEYCIWDSALPDFGLRVRPTGRYYWFVRVRHRNKHRRISLGRTDEVEAEFALDGLPKHAAVKTTPLFADYVDTCWPDIARYWKPMKIQGQLSAVINRPVQEQLFAM